LREGVFVCAGADFEGVSMSVFAEHVREMNERVIELSRSHAILWVLQDTSNYKRYSTVFRNRPDFFDAIAISLFQGFCVITYQLFDKKRGDVKSLPSLIKHLSSLNPGLGRRLNSNIDAQQALLDRYFCYRHKIFAHRDKKKSPSEVFGSVQKSRAKREMEGIVCLARNTVCALAGASGVSKKAKMFQLIHLREGRARWDAKLVLEDIAKNMVI
jgi:hypothetical protein